MRNLPKITCLNVWLIGLLLALSGSLHAQTAGGTPATAPLIIGTKESPPFSMKDANGEWTGISIDLWRQIAKAQGFGYEFREHPLTELLEGVKTGRLSAAVAAVTVTPQREIDVDFSHPFYTSGIGIATSAERAGILALLKRLFSSGFLKAVAVLTLLLSVVGALVWWFERRGNPQQFGGGPVRGLGSGFWWSAVTMTTVGYGDKAPVTPGGRLVALVWMFASLLLISSITGAIASALTVDQLTGLVRNPKDLPRVEVGTVTDSTSEAYLKAQGIAYRAFDQVSQGLDAILAREIDAMVYDAPLLQYTINQNYGAGLRVLPHTLLRQDYAIALPTGSTLRETVNRALEKQIQSPQWEEILLGYLGQR